MHHRPDTRRTRRNFAMSWKEGFFCTMDSIRKASRRFIGNHHFRPKEDDTLEIADRLRLEKRDEAKFVLEEVAQIKLESQLEIEEAFDEAVFEEEARRYEEKRMKREWARENARWPEELPYLEEPPPNPEQYLAAEAWEP